ncbi:MAG: pyruvate formate lyase-activating protein [Actinobacteria bacterium]|nr:pyruvate formate lyase-activating protein [Actinomycetota bacterium]
MTGTGRILALDIGAGTQDILLYDTGKKLENCVKLVLPSPGALMAETLRSLGAEKTAQGLFVGGYTVGGGAFSRAIKEHLAAGTRVWMSREAAFSLRNNLADVKAMGVTILEDPPPGFEGVLVLCDELDLGPLRDLFASVGESLDDLDAAAVAVQDHGIYETGESNRKTRLAHMRRRLEEDPDPLSLSYLEGEIPATFPRMFSAARRLRDQLSCEKILVMDTAPAAVAGCLADRHVAERAGGNLLLINAGNGHTLACVTSGGEAVAVLEHHTKKLEPRSFAEYLKAFCAGEARDEDDFMASGHGLFYLQDPPGMGGIDLVAVTGPNRDLLEGTDLEVYYPSPGGDMMMTGPLGLVRAVQRRFEGHMNV